MERSGIQGLLAIVYISPDYASLHPGCGSSPFSLWEKVGMRGCMVRVPGSYNPNPLPGGEEVRVLLLLL
jgi:hypothetical protein